MCECFRFLCYDFQVYQILLTIIHWISYIDG